MEIFELTFTAFMAVILSFAVAKILSLLVSNSNNGGNTVFCSFSGSTDAKEEGLGVRIEKGEKRFSFVEDVEVKKLDRCETGNGYVYESSFDEVGGMIVEDKNEETSGCKRVDRDEGLGLNNGHERKNLQNESSNVGESGGVYVQCKVCEINEMLEKDREVYQLNEVCGVKEITSVTGNGKDFLIVDDEKNEMALDCENSMLSHREDNEVVSSGEDVCLREKEEGSVEDDWEGIERSELEKMFAEAVNYVEFGGKGQTEDDDRLVKLDSDVKMHLYALHKVALEGPCHDPQPMALMVSSRAKWNAWKKLGSMSQEDAMEKYIKLVSDNLPAWIQGCSAEDDIQYSYSRNDLKNERNLGLHGIPGSIIDPIYVENMSTNLAKD